MLIHKGYQGSHFDYLSHSSVKENFKHSHYQSHLPTSRKHDKGSQNDYLDSLYVSTL